MVIVSQNLFMHYASKNGRFQTMHLRLLQSMLKLDDFNMFSLLGSNNVHTGIFLDDFKLLPKIDVHAINFRFHSVH